MAAKSSPFSIPSASSFSASKIIRCSAASRANIIPRLLRLSSSAACIQFNQNPMCASQIRATVSTPRSELPSYTAERHSGELTSFWNIPPLESTTTASSSTSFSAIRYHCSRSSEKYCAKYGALATRSERGIVSSSTNMPAGFAPTMHFRCGTSVSGATKKSSVALYSAAATCSALVIQESFERASVNDLISPVIPRDAHAPPIDPSIASAWSRTVRSPSDDATRSKRYSAKPCAVAACGGASCGSERAAVTVPLFVARSAA
mmetsp:Transcript_6593/g.17712  ORF Transcript_6593/g.17712 Transcript_6593/m.17712 type:complete len:262 (+) Transcript_6593:172-957(+)